MIGRIGKDVLDLLSVTLALAVRAGNSIRGNWSLAVVAILLSTALWVAVTNEQNPPRVDVFPNTLIVEPANVPSGLGLFHSLDTVRVKVSAPLESWNRLTPSSFRVVADLSRASQGMQEVMVRVESADRQVRVLEVVPSKVPVRLDVVIEKTVPVRVNLLDSVPFGYSFKTPSVSPDRVKVIGAEALVKKVEAAEADLKLEGAKVSISQSTKLTPRDAQGSLLDGVRLEPQTAVVDVPIEQQLNYATVPINPSIAGNVASGYWAAGVSVSPSTIMIVGDRDAVEPINYVSTDQVDVTGADSDVVKVIGLSAPSGVSLVGVQKVTVRVTVVPSEGRKSFTVSPSFSGLQPERQASAGSIDVTISGPLPVLQRTDVAQITATVDLNGHLPGSYKLAPRITLPDGLRLVRVVPELVDVQIMKEAGTPSPSPSPSPSG